MTNQALLIVVASFFLGPPPPPSDRPSASPDQATPQQTDDAATAALAAFNKRLEEIDAKVAVVKDVRARFEQRRQTPLLKKPMVSKGDMVGRGETVRWDTKEPRRSTMIVGEPKNADDQSAGEQIRIYYPEDRLVEVYQTGSNDKQFMGALLPRLSALRARFDLKPMSVKDAGGSEENPHLLAVLLEPREEKLRKHVRSVQVLIDESIPAAVRVVVTDLQGDKTEISFSDVRTNTGVALSEVELQLPHDVRYSYPTRGNAAKPATPAPSSSPPSTPAADGAKPTP